MNNEILRAQYDALRQEVLATQRRDFQVISVGALVIPGVNYLAQTKAEPLALALPLLVIVVVLMHLANTHAIFRIARYISDKIEPELEPIIGWETWLRSTETDQGRRRSDNRRAERYMRSGVFLLFGAYFGAATWFAVKYALDKAGFVGALALLAFYIAVGVLLATYVWKNLPVAPDGDDRDKPQPMR